MPPPGFPMCVGRGVAPHRAASLVILSPKRTDNEGSKSACQSANFPGAVPRPAKAGLVRPCDYPNPASGSLEPVAIGAAVEETKPSERLRKMCRSWRCSEPTGRNASER